MAKDPNITPISAWPAGKVPGGIAVAPDGTMWVVDRTNNKETSGNVLIFDKDGKLLFTHALPELPNAAASIGIKPRPAYITLQLDSGNKVLYAWVGDAAGGIVYRLEPGKTDAKDVKVVDLSVHAYARGIAWDAKGQQVWVADSGKSRLVAINPAKAEIDTALTKPMPVAGVAPQMLAVTHSGDVWFTAYGNGIGMVFAYRAATKDFVWGNIGLTDSGPYGIVIDEKKQRVWITATQDSGLWRMDMQGVAGLSAGASLAPVRITSFPIGSEPYEITIDNAGYLWVADSQKVYELNPDGAITHTYDAEAKEIFGLAHAGAKDLIWVSDGGDASTPAALLQLKPVDQLIDPLHPEKTSQVWTITARPNEDAVAAGDPFPPITITTATNSGTGSVFTPKSADISLSVPPYIGAYFDKPGNNTQPLRTKPDGTEIVVLHTAADAPANDFTIVAMMRGFTNPVVIYHGRIGIPASSIKIDPAFDVAEYAQVNRLFAATLKLTVTPPTAWVRLRTNSRFGAVFSDGQADTVLRAHPKTGELEIALKAGTKAEELLVTAESAVSKVGVPPTKSGFKPRTVTEEPAALVISNPKLEVRKNDASAEFSASVHDASKGGVPGIWVQLLLIPPNSGTAKDAPQFYEKSGTLPDITDKPMKKQFLLIQTDRNGTVKFGPNEKYYFRCSEDITNMSMEVQVFDLSLRAHPDLIFRETVSIQRQ